MPFSENTFNYPLEKETKPEKDTKLVDEREKIFDEMEEIELENVLLTAQIINYGNHGIIFRININELKENFNKKDDSEKPELRAIKLLKVYSEGKGKREFERQLEAYQLVESAKETNLAKIPKPISFRSIHISPRTREYLNKLGASLTGDKIEVIVMEYIDGEDLAKIFFRWIVEKHPEREREIEPRDKNNINELHFITARLLGFSVPLQKGNSEELLWKERKIYNENSQKLYRFLKQSGFVFHPKLVEKIKKTISIFHSVGFYHNDLHERNIMVVGNLDDPNAQIFIVDFANAGEADPERIDDFSVIARLTELSKEKTDPYEEFKKELEEIITIRKRKTSREKSFQDFLVFLERKREITFLLESKFAEGIVDDKSLFNFFYLIIEMVRNKILGKELLITFIENKLKENQQKKEKTRLLSPFVSNKLLNFLRYLKEEV